MWQLPHPGTQKLNIVNFSWFRRARTRELTEPKSRLKISFPAAR